MSAEKRGRGRPPKLKEITPEQFGEILPPISAKPPAPVRQLNPHDPSIIEPWPRTLPLEVALGLTDNPETVCKAYKLTADEWFHLQHDPDFLAAVAEEREGLKKDGATFQKKAALQAEVYLQTAWKLIHDPDTPAPQKADLIKSTIRWAGYDNKDSVNVGTQVGLSINLILGDK